MANISAELQAILDAVYGEDVRGSIHDAIALINSVSEVVFSCGTAVTSATSPSAGFYADSLYLNTNTYDLWKCVGTDTWTLEGNLQGQTGNGIASITLVGTSGLIDTYEITYTDGTTTTFDVTNGKDGQNGNKWYRGLTVSGKSVNPTQFTLTYDVVVGDNYINTSEGAVYHCTQGATANNGSLWAYDFTMTGGGGGGTSAWGSITGTLSDQLDLKNALDAKLDKTAEYITSVTSNEFTVNNHGLALDSAITNKLQKLDANGNLPYSAITGMPTIPTKTSDLNNDSGFVTDTSIDEWHKYNGSVEIITVSTANTATSITFHGINSAYGYELFSETLDGSLTTVDSSSLIGSDITYSVKVATVPATFKLRTIK